MKVQAFRCPSCNSGDIHIDKMHRMHCMSCGTISQILDQKEETPEDLRGKAEYRRADAEYIRAKAEYIDAGTRRRAVKNVRKERIASRAIDFFKSLGRALVKLFIFLYNLLRRPVMLAIWVLMFPLLFHVLPWPSLFDGFFNSIGQWLFNLFCFLVLIVGGLFVIIKLWSDDYDIDSY